MPLEHDLIRRIRKLDEFDLRRLEILVRGLLVSRLGESVGDRLPGEGPRVTYRQQTVRCGKERCGRCPHGPYWYAYWREEGKLRSRYIGKERPAAPEDRPPR